MRWAMAAGLMLAMAGPAAAIECPVSHALYHQDGGGKWTMQFRPLPEDAPANQVAAFEIVMPGTPRTVLDGGIYIPNGYGQTWGDLRLDPADTSGEPFWDGVVYALVDGKIDEFPSDTGNTGYEPISPQQVLLPKFGSTVWYSGLRDKEFAERDYAIPTLETFTLDAFTLATCVK